MRHVCCALAVLVLSLVAAPGLAAHGSERAPARDHCSPEALFAEASAGLRDGSPALQRYLRNLLQEAALITPNDVLLQRLRDEDDPAMLEALGAAVAHKAETMDEPSLVAGLLGRAARDGDPALRAAAVRALRGTGSVELMANAAVDVDYLRLVRDPAPQVREAVVENLVVEDDDVYSGHSAELSEAAFAVARQADDAAVRARLVAAISTERIGADTAAWLTLTLHDDQRGVRVAAAQALGGVGPEHAGSARAALVARYLVDDDVEVRRAMLAALARLERARAIPILETLRTVDARLDAEVDAWIAVLRLGLPEWSLVVRERGRR